MKRRHFLQTQPIENQPFLETKRIAAMLEGEWNKYMKAKRLPKVWNGKFTKPVTKNYKISICTTCKDRLENLKQTLPRNIEDNLNYPNVEFIVLDYNSKKEDVGGWIKKEMMRYVEKGILVYLRTNEPKYFDMSHSRNIAFLAASGEIVNNVDADAFCGKGFAEFINKCANERPEKAIFAKSKQLLRGRLGLFKKEFIEVTGYSEAYAFHYGHDDADLMHRCWELGMLMMSFSRHGKFVGIVPHHIKHQEDGNYPFPWWKTEGENRLLSFAHLLSGRFKANEGRIWGKARLIKNFDGEKIETGIQG